MGSYATGQQDSSQNRSGVNVLLTERETVLKEIVDYTKTKYMQGVASLEEVTKAELELLSSQLETAKTVEDRLKLLELQVQNAEKQEREIEDLVKSGVRSTQDLRRAKVNRLNAKIALSREQHGQ